MRVLVIGAGAREHTLCWTLRRSPEVEFLACLPGNGGTAEIAVNVPLDPLQNDACVAWAIANQIDLTIVGPEDPLSAGIVDAFQARGLTCFGPTQAAARIESSKVWSKQFMQRHDIPTAPARIVTAATLASAIADLRVPDAVFPIAVKADGLAAGKGVVLAHDAATAVAALREMIEQQRFGVAGASVLLEDFLTGREVSVFAICAGTNYRLLGTACDHKAAYDGDKGPNTGGMGAYTPADWLDAAMLDEIEHTIIAPTVAGMAADGVPFTGFLFTGIMMTDAGPRVVEFNARFGDPEAEVILPLLETPLLDLVQAAATGTLAHQPPLTWRDGAECGVVVVAGDYPASGDRGSPITFQSPLDPDLLVFHGGTRLASDGALETNGGRVLTVVGFGADRAAACAQVYANIDRIHFDGAWYRHDIGKRDA